LSAEVGGKRETQNMKKTLRRSPQKRRTTKGGSNECFFTLIKKGLTWRTDYRGAPISNRYASGSGILLEETGEKGVGFLTSEIGKERESQRLKSRKHLKRRQRFGIKGGPFWSVAGISVSSIKGRPSEGCAKDDRDTREKLKSAVKGRERG